MGEQGMQRLRSAHLLLSLLPVFSPFSIFFTFRRGGGGGIDTNATTTSRQSSLSPTPIEEEAENGGTHLLYRK
jgi:hypothetical protein